jgi:hypothetical protein
MSGGIGRITGPLLKDNLVRNGVDLSFETDLLYLDVNTNKIGIKTDSPGKELFIEQYAQTIDLIVDDYITANKIEINNTSNIFTSLDKLYLDAQQSIIAPGLKTDKLIIDNNAIFTTTANTDIEIRPTGQLVVDTNTDIFGSVHSTGDITIGGNVVFGNDDEDNVDFNSDVKSDITPDLDITYTLGNANKRWNNLYTKSANAQLVVADRLITPADITFNLRFENSWFVSTTGSNSNVGDYQNAPFRNLSYALSRATAGDTVFVYPGTYIEIFPLTVPAGVNIVGFDIRTTIIKPTELTKFKDAFLLNGETTVSDITIKDFNYDSNENTGHAFRFADNFTVTSRSPYVQNVSVITKENLGIITPTQITAGPAVTLFSFTSNSVTLSKEFYSQNLVDSLVGQTAVIDIYPNPPLVYTVVSIETEPLSPTLWRMTVDTTFNPAGQLKPISFYPDAGAIELITNDIWDTTGNSVGEKWVAWFKTNLPVNFETTVQPGWTINVAGTLYIVDYIVQDPVNADQWRIYVTTSLVGGVGIPIFSSPSVSASLSAGRGAYIDGSVATTASKEASMLFHSCTFITPGVDAVTITNGVRVEWLNSFTYFANRGLYATNGTLGFASQGTTFGGEIRSIGSANVYGNYGVVADGSETLFYLINHNFGYVGSGLDSSNDSTLTIQENETVELNSGKIYYTSQSQDGDFRIGDSFLVDFETGTVSFDTAGIDLQGVSSMFFQGAVDRTFLEAEKIETGDFLIENNTIRTLTRDFNLVSATEETYFDLDVRVLKNLVLTENLLVGGNVFLGNQSLDSITFNTEFTQDLYPKLDNTYNIGSTDKRWKDVNSVTVVFDDIEISNNSIATTVADSDLILTGNSDGGVKLKNLLFKNSTISSYSNQNIKLTPNTGKNLVIGGTYGVQIPRTTATLNLAAELRFNPLLSQYEGFSTALLTLGGVYSSDKLTSVLTTLDSNVINFTTNNITNTTLSETTFRTNRFETGTLILDNNTLSSTIGNISLVGTTVSLGGIIFEDGILSVAENENIQLTTVNQGYVQFASTTAIELPAGPEDDRPTAPIIGNTRFNTEKGYMEVWSGTAWVSVSGEGDLADSEYATESTTIWSLVMG